MKSSTFELGLILLSNICTTKLSNLNLTTGVISVIVTFVYIVCMDFYIASFSLIYFILLIYFMSNMYGFRVIWLVHV